MVRDNISEISEARLKRGLGPTNFRSGGGNEPPEMREAGERLARLEGAYDLAKVVAGLILAVMIGGFAFLGTQMASLTGQIGRLDGKIDTIAQRLDAKIDASAARVNEKLDAIPQQLAEEFRAMRADMSAQTSAIANSITAAKQAPPQVLLVPAPAIEPPAQKP
jgi:flagellar capping protein FliD